VLAQAMTSIDGVRLDPQERAQITEQILQRALDLVQRSGPNSQVMIGTHAAEDGALRDGLEATYRTLAGTADTDEERYAMVDRANSVRRWTLT
jgi:serine/threonine-protein kinase PknG